MEFLQTKGIDAKKDGMTPYELVGMIQKIKE
jgi:hypothetical protein